MMPQHVAAPLRLRLLHGDVRIAVFIGIDDSFEDRAGFNERSVDGQARLNLDLELHDGVISCEITLKSIARTNPLRTACQALQLLQQDLDSWELEQLLSGKYDDCGCRLTIMAGAGGTEAQDWAQMLQRMYLRFFERRGFKYKIVEEEVRWGYSWTSEEEGANSSVACSNTSSWLFGVCSSGTPYPVAVGLLVFCSRVFYGRGVQSIGRCRAKSC